MEDQVPANMPKHALLVMMHLYLRGKMIATARSIVRGSKANIPEFAQLFIESAQTTQPGVVLLFTTPTYLLLIIPRPLKKPRVEITTSLTATLMMRRFLQFASLIRRSARKQIVKLLKRMPRSAITARTDPQEVIFLNEKNC